MNPSPPTPGDLPAPGLTRRLACFVYEGVLLFGVVMLVGLLYGVLTNQRHALVGSTGLQAVIFLSLGLYFIWFWTRHGQTLPMRTWHIKLVTVNGGTPGVARAVGRYLLSWLWFMPALLIVHFSGLKGAAPTVAALLAGVLGYACLARLHPDRQYLHDAACGTRMVTVRLGAPR